MKVHKSKQFYELQQPIKPEDFYEIAQHLRMQIIEDKELPDGGGRLRLLRFRREDKQFQGWFDIVSYPGTLIINGDYGCYAFARTPDMFDFFRTSRKEPNVDYWASKCLQPRKTFTAYSPELFVHQVVDWIVERVKGGDRFGPELRQRIRDEVIGEAENGQIAAISAALNFEDEAGHSVFQDFYEVTTEAYDFGFLWCLYAVMWAVQQYDKAKEQ